MDADLVIIGAGASAALLLDALRRRCPAAPYRVVVVERAHDPGRGVAYRTQDPAHRMNVPAVRLSADPDDPTHLLRWLADRGRPAAAGEYLPRRTYGDYLEAVLAGSDRRDRHVRMSVEPASAVRVDRRPGRLGVGLADGRTIFAPDVALAVGPSPGPVPLPLEPGLLRGDPDLITDPWAPGALDQLDGGRIVVVGTGLTMVDVALTALRRPGTVVDAVSRHGVLPLAHPDERLHPSLPLDVPEEGPLTAAGLLRALRDQAGREPSGWQATVDQFRDASDELWPRLPVVEQARLLRRLGHAWGVHRHRMSPPVAAALDEAVAAGRLRLHAGRVAGIGRTQRLGARPVLAVSVCQRRSSPLLLHGDQVVTCTGPSTDVRCTTDPMLRHLLRTGLASVGPHRLGFAVDDHGTLFGRTGRPVDGLSAIGPLRRGTVFETTAIPELRAQAAALAARLVP